MSAHYSISNCGDHAITVELGDAIDPVTHQQIIALFQQLSNANIIGIKDIIPAYTTITVVYDIAAIKKATDTAACKYISEQIEKAISECAWKNESSTREISIPVCYDISLGIDLPEMSKQKNISIEEIISIHTSATYNVYMLGFLPGFAYMGIVDDKIAVPRLSQPRKNVPAGSVGIAGNQTGIYPLDSPGGWNIIGQTPLRMFDISNEDPCLVKPGDKIKFVAISLGEFDQQKSK
jgi:inhibitor of KinA